jgi:hypothetical protein
MALVVGVGVAVAAIVGVSTMGAGNTVAVWVRVMVGEGVAFPLVVAVAT